MEIAKKDEVEKMKMDEEDSPNQIIYIKYKEEENIKKVLLAMKDEGKIAEITTIEEKRINMMEVVGEKHTKKKQKN